MKTILILILLFYFTTIVQVVEADGPDIINNENEEEYYDTTISDPFESFNKIIFVFNDHVYIFIIKPVVKGYSYLLPEDFRIAIRNFFHNLSMPVRFVNCVLQGKINDAGKELLRFGINTTAGVFGFADVAKEIGISAKNEDFGQTLAVYGVTEGAYIVLPILGPSTVRDTIGLVADAFLDPINHFSELETVITLQSYKFINRTSLHIKEYERVKALSLDPYTSLKDMYLQHRQKEVKE